MTIKEELRLNWHHVMAVCVWHGKRNEGCPIDEKWKTFDGFYADNIQRYYRAKKKWANYKRITPLNADSRYRVRHINFIRKVKERGFTKKNTCFTSASDRMKFHTTYPASPTTFF